MTWEAWIEEADSTPAQRRLRRVVVRAIVEGDVALAESLSRTVTATLIGWRGPAGERIAYVRDLTPPPTPPPAPATPAHGDDHDGNDQHL